MNINENIDIKDLQTKIVAINNLAKSKIILLNKRWNSTDGTPVFTRDGKYTSYSWTEWTQGFQIGMSILVFDIDGDEAFLQIGKNGCLEKMASHLTHIGVHDHGFNNVSTYGNLLRLMNEKSMPENQWERHFYELALKVSGAVQSARWTRLSEDRGFVHSFNGPHSLFADTIRSMRSLSLGYILGHELKGEQDSSISLLQRLIFHAEATSKYNVYFGKNRDSYDERGRVAHESVFNIASKVYRCPNSQQGFSPFTTWTRGHAWILCGYAEQLEWLATISDKEFESIGRKKKDVLELFLETAMATADFYLDHMPSDGVPYWDTGAPQLHKIKDHKYKNADPFNDYEPVDSSAGAIAAQGLVRLGLYMNRQGNGHRYFQAGLTVANSLLQAPYISEKDTHEGLLLHSIYHYPNGWDYIPKGSKIPYGESSMWGDYHLLELSAYINRLAQGKDYTFGWKEMQNAY